MKILAKLFVVLFSVLAIITLIFYYAFPKITTDFASYLRADAAYLKINKINIEGTNLHFYKGGKAAKKDTIVLLHGWVDDKKGFLKLAKYLTEDYYLIIPDLPGQGENEKNKNFEYTFKKQASLVSKLLDTLNINNYHLVGVSTGGVISLCIGTLKPNQVNSITLVNTPYLEFTNQEFFAKFSKRVKNRFDLYEVLNIAFYKKPKFSKPIEHMLIQRIDLELDFVYTTIINNLNDNELKDFESSLFQLDVPILLLHSTNDTLVSENHASNYEEILLNSKYGTIINTGHYPQYENPSKLASCISDQVKTTALKTNCPL